MFKKETIDTCKQILTTLNKAAEKHFGEFARLNMIKAALNQQEEKI